MEGEVVYGGFDPASSDIMGRFDIHYHSESSKGSRSDLLA